MEETTNSSNASSRVLRRLETAMLSGNFYEAHQTYRTLYFRFISQPQKHEELLQLLYDGSTKLLDFGQTTSGCDLAILLTEVLQKTSKPVDEKTLDRVEAIFERLIRLGTTTTTTSTSALDDEEEEDEESEAKGKSNSNSVDASSDRDAFVGNLVKWSKIVAPKFKNGHPSLHARLAGTWWRMKNYQQARYHFLLSDDGEACANFLIEYHTTRGYRNEVDLFVTQAVLQFLCHKNKSTANTVFFHYTQYHPYFTSNDVSSSSATKSKNIETDSSSSSVDGPPYSLPLLNFVWLLLLCIDTGRVTDFTLLIEQYQPSIKRDSNYFDYLDRIGQLFFRLPPPTKTTNQSGLGGAFLKNLMSGLLGDDNENAAEDGPSSSADDENFESVPGTPPLTSSANGINASRQVKSKLTTDETLD